MKWYRGEALAKAQRVALTEGLQEKDITIAGLEERNETLKALGSDFFHRG